MAGSWAANSTVDMALSRQLGNVIGHLAIVGFYLALAGIGMLVSGSGREFGPLDGLVVLDAVAGAVLRGIVVVVLVSRLGPQSRQ